MTYVHSFRFISTSRLGIRGGFLLTMAVLSSVYGGSIMFPDQATMERADTVWRNNYAHPLTWGIMWCIVGAVCLVTAFMRRDQLGFGVASFWLVFWSLQGLSSQIWGGYARGYVTAVIFLAFLAAIVLASGIHQCPDQKVTQPPYDQNGNADQGR
jgi:hypothetical protein